MATLRKNTKTHKKIETSANKDMYVIFDKELLTKMGTHEIFPGSVKLLDRPHNAVLAKGTPSSRKVDVVQSSKW